MSERRTTGALNVLPAAAAWWRYEGRHHLFMYFILPAGIGAVVFALDRQIDDWGSLESGLLFLTGLLMTSLFQVFQWGRDAVTELEFRAGDPYERGRQQRRLEAVERTYRSIVWATLVALSLSVGVVVMSTKSASDLEAAVSTNETVIVAVLGSHLVVILVTIINRIFIVTRSDLKNAADEVKGKRRRQGAAG